MHIYGTYRTRLRTVPMQPNARRTVLFEGHRFRCPCRQETVTELNPYRCPETRITKQAAVWIPSLLAQGLTIAGVQKITGIHWNTIRQAEGKANRRSGKPRQMPGEGDDDTWLGGDRPGAGYSPTRNETSTNRHAPSHP